MVYGEEDSKKSQQTQQQRDFKRLRVCVDKDDRFMQAHQTHKNREFNREVPEWMFNDKMVAAFLLKRFPPLNQGCLWGTPPDLYRYCECKPCCQRSRAGLWMFTIYHCFRRGVTATDAAVYWNEQHHDEDHHLTEDKILRVVQMIRLAAEGKRLDGKPRSFGKPGRPKKSACRDETTLTIPKTVADSRPEEARLLDAIMAV